MNLYLRLICLLLRLPFMPKPTHPLDATQLDMRVWPNDLDLNMHMNNGRYLTVMDLGRLHLTFVNGLLGPCLKRGWLPVLGSAKIHYLKPLNLFQKYTLESKVIYWDKKWIYMEQHFFKKDVLCATALLKALFVGKEGKIPSQKLIDLIGRDIICPPASEALKRWIECEKRDAVQ